MALLPLFLLVDTTPAMVAASVEQLKRQYTDKYVKVDAARPELARFRDVVGQVKTVNMSGRALVEFLDYHLNIGWFDIDLSCLTVVDKPEPKPAEAKQAEPKKAPAEKPAAKPAPAAATPAKPAAGGKKMSVAEMLAAARGGDAAKGAAPAAPKAKEAPAAKPAGAAPKAKGKMSVAEMLAAARAADAGGGAAVKAPAEEATPTAAEEAPAAPPKPAAEVTAPAKPAAGEIKRVDRSKMSVAEMIAYCREHDAK
jgi:hypothetical protein